MIKIFGWFENYGDEIPVKTFKFSGGEIQVRLELEDNEKIPLLADITAHLHSSDDIMELLLVTNALKKLNNEISISLCCYYLPYARQDRVCYPGEAFSLEVMAQLLNLQNYNWIKVLDVHSPVSETLIERLYNIPFPPEIENIPISLTDTVIAPDKGALERANNFAFKREISNVLHANKVRDPNTGQILKTEVPGIEKTKGNFIIVDDICDGGRTFIELAKVLRPYTDEKIILYVTHGIFSQGFDVFRGIIDEIYVANLVNVKYDLPDFVHVL